MISILFGLIVFPAAFMFAAVRLGFCHTWKTAVAMLLLAACAMPLLIVVVTRSADSMALSVSPTIMALLVLFSLVPASLSAAIAKRA